MNNTLVLHAKDEILQFLQQDTFLNIYSIGDLDDFFWPYTIWYGLRERDTLQAILLLYVGQPLPVLLALATPSETPYLETLFQVVSHLLPRRFYSHLSSGLEGVAAQKFHLEPHGEHYRMGLVDPTLLTPIDTTAAIPLTGEDLPAITRFYEAGYPGNWFDARMLETGQYFGVMGAEGLASVAGIHVYSEQYRVAALGNIATLPHYRGQGLGKVVTARLCQSLAKRVDHIGLNVKANNQPAIGLYQRLGFEVVGRYGEYMLEAR